MGGEARLSSNDLRSLEEMVFEDLFLEVAEEECRLKGGPYHNKRFIPIEEILVVLPDMESIIDARREELALSEELTLGSCYPAPEDLLPFYAIMASADDEPFHPHFSSSSFG